jgi:hypothetical protein
MLIILNLLQYIVCNGIPTESLVVAQVKMLDGEVGKVDTIVDG